MTAQQIIKEIDKEGGVTSYFSKKYCRVLLWTMHKPPYLLGYILSNFECSRIVAAKVVNHYFDKYYAENIK